MPSSVNGIAYNPVSPVKTVFKKDRMKHMTCYYYLNLTCKYAEDECAYSHVDLGPGRRADPPVLLEPGKPAVAGKNALKDNPDYVDWAKVHAGHQDSYHSTPVYHPPTTGSIPPTPYPYPGVNSEVRAQIKSIHAKHGVQEEIKSNEETSENGIKMEDPSDDDASSLPAVKHLKVDSSIPPRDQDPEAALKQEIAENQFLRSIVEDFATMTSILVKDQGSQLRRQAREQEELLKQIVLLDEKHKTPFLRPLAECTDFTSKLATANGQITGLMDKVRQKLVDQGLGGLVNTWDEEFCSVTTETPVE
ncbi:MAG: hypothetical protein Q9170_007362 [Blastenia crenularia]